MKSTGLAACAVVVLSTPASAALIYPQSFTGYFSSGSYHIDPHSFGPEATIDLRGLQFTVSFDPVLQPGDAPLTGAATVNATFPYGGSMTFVQSTFNQTLNGTDYRLDVFGPAAIENWSISFSLLGTYADGVFSNLHGSVNMGGQIFPEPASWTLSGAFVNQLSVPEPATWAMMIAGFGIAGAAARQRRRALA